MADIIHFSTKKTFTAASTDSRAYAHIQDARYQLIYLAILSDISRELLPESETESQPSLYDVVTNALLNLDGKNRKKALEFCPYLDAESEKIFEELSNIFYEEIVPADGKLVGNPTGKFSNQLSENMHEIIMSSDFKEIINTVVDEIARDPDTAEMSRNKPEALPLKILLKLASRLQGVLDVTPAATLSQEKTLAQRAEDIMTKTDHYDLYGNIVEALGAKANQINAALKHDIDDVADIVVKAVFPLLKQHLISTSLSQSETHEEMENSIRVIAKDQALSLYGTDHLPLTLARNISDSLIVGIEGMLENYAPVSAIIMENLPANHNTSREEGAEPAPHHPDIDA